MKHLLLGLFLFIQLPYLILAQKDFNYDNGMKWGKYDVGHRKMFGQDTSRTYDYSLGDSTMGNMKYGRPILMNIYYPAKKSKGGQKIVIQDLWQFTGNTQMSHFLKNFQAYELDMSKKYAIDDNLKLNEFTGDTSSYRTTMDQLFKQYSSTNLFSKDGLEPLSQDLPVVIYHQGLGGTFDENILMIELLASHGFLVITSSFVNSDASWTLGVGDTDASIGDIDFIINYTQSSLSYSNQIFLMGHSFGANTIFTYPAVGKHRVSGIIPLDSDYGYSYYYHMNEKNAPDLSNQKNYIDLPIFAAGRSDAHFRMIDLLDKSNRNFLKVNHFKHNDFCAQTIIGAAQCLPYSTQQEQIRSKRLQYQKLNELILTFLKNCLKDNQKNLSSIPLDTNQMILEVVDAGERSLMNARFEIGEKKCPTNTQLLDLIELHGIQIAGEEWLNCNELKDTATFDFEWISIFDALLHEKTTAHAIQFLEFYVLHRPLDQHLGGFAYFTYEKSFTDYGDGFHFYKANQIFKWMTQNVPNEIEGYKGMIMNKRVEEYHAEAEQKERLTSELELMCTALLEQFPNYFNLPVDNDWDETIQRIVKKNTEKID